MSDSDAILACLRCYEPPGEVIHLSRELAVKHILATGATGSGKTSSLIDPCLEQFMQFANASPSHRLGLLILDPKADSISKLRVCAKQANRGDDLRILGQNAHYDVFSGLVSLAQVDHFTRLLMSGTADMGPLNSYFEETRRGLLASSICLLLANGGPISFFQAADFLTACWFSSERNDLLDKKLKFAHALLNVGRLSEATRRRLQLAVQDVESFFKLDARLRETHRSSILNVLRPLLDPVAQRLFSGEGGHFAPREVLDGRVLLASVDAQLHPELASLVFRLVKRDFFQAIHGRGAADLERDRLCMLVVDEYCLAAENEDIANLATCRSRGAGVLAATQGLSALDEKLGRRKRDALLANFGSMFFFPNRERATDEEAFLRLGYQDEEPQNPYAPSVGRIVVSDPLDLPNKARVCEIGALSRLTAHQAFVTLSDGTRTRKPIWLAPSFYAIPETSSSQPEPDDLAQEVERLKSVVVGEPAVAALPAKGQFLAQMHQAGHRLWLLPRIVEALWRLCEPAEPRERLLAILTTQDGGVAQDVPGCWVAGLHAFLRCHERLDEELVGLAVADGVLLLRLDDRFDADPERLNWQEMANLWIYPSLWRPAKRMHLRRLWAECPDLRPELQTLPQVGGFEETRPPSWKKELP